ncbi:MAG: hypothetical protein HRT94_02790 [Alphaproteobacteria bacterium]|nr:hypothetical protein [Alphaproteobacteria bacterium]
MIATVIIVAISALWSHNDTRKATTALLPAADVFTGFNKADTIEKRQLEASSNEYTTHYTIARQSNKYVDVYVHVSKKDQLAYAEIRGLSPKEKISWSNKQGQRNLEVSADWSGKITTSKIKTMPSLCIFMSEGKQAICHTPNGKEEGNNV